MAIEAPFLALAQDIFPAVSNFFGHKGTKLRQIVPSPVHPFLSLSDFCFVFFSPFMEELILRPLELLLDDRLY